MLWYFNTMKQKYFSLEKIGRIRLSDNFYMRQFLYSEIAAVTGILNVPDDLDMAIETGMTLCSEILEPLVREFGPIVVRSGFRSAKLNDFGARHRLACASNEKNFAYHIWDRRDHDGHAGAAACIVIPHIVTEPQDHTTWRRVASWINDNLDYHRLTFFRKDFAFNIGWHEAPVRDIYSYLPEPHWVARNGRMLSLRRREPEAQKGRLLWDTAETTK